MPTIQRSIHARAVTTALVVAGLLSLVPAFASGAAAAGQAPQIWIAKRALQFGNAVPSTVTAAQVVTVTNTGGGPETALSVGPTESSYFTASNDCTSTLAVGASCHIFVRFTPISGPGEVQGGIIVSSSAGPTLIELGGHALAPTSPFSVAVRALDFGEVPTGSPSPAQSVLVTNSSASSVPVSFTGPTIAAPFSVTTTCAGVVLASGASCRFDYVFTPDAAVESGTTSTISLTGGGTTLNVPVALHGTGLQTFQVDGTALDFGEVAVGQAAAAQTTVLTNTSPSTQTIVTQETAPANGFSVTDQCDRKVLAPGATCTITYRFTPTSAGATTSSSQLTISRAGSASTVTRTISLSGRGLSGARTEPFRITSRGLGFGNVGMGTSVQRKVTITNVTTSALTPDLAVDSDLGVSATTDCGLLGRGASCNVFFAFSPPAPGTWVLAPTLTVSTDGFADQVVSVNLRAFATKPFRVSPTSLDLGRVAVGSQSPDQAVTITNVTTAPIQVGASGGDGGPVGSTQNCGGTVLAPGASCSYRYGYAPVAALTVSADAVGTVSGGGYDQPFAVHLAGTGFVTAPFASVSPSSIEFGDAPKGFSPPTQPLVVTNSGTGPLTDIAVDAGTNSRFQVSEGCTSLLPGASCTFQVVFIPRATGPTSGTFTVTSSDDPIVVHVAGTGRDLPVAFQDGYQVNVDGSLHVNAAEGVLANDTGIGLTAVSPTAPSHGTLALAADGSFTYTPDSAYRGTDSFSYAAVDTIGFPKRATVILTVAYTTTQSFLQAAFRDFLGRAPTDNELREHSGAIATGAQTEAGEVKALSSSTEYITALVSSFYVNTLGRAGDPGGTAYWVGQLRTKQRTVAQVASFFYASDEYFTGIGGGTNSTWVTDLYRKLLGRSPDSAGLAYWVGQVRSTGRVSVAGRFYQSSESCHARVKALYQALLGRNPDQAGWDYWSAQIPARGDLALAANLASSPEYRNRAVTRFP